eukprot:1139364-Pelagomonas_calceolata.AAC.2
MWEDECYYTVSIEQASDDKLTGATGRRHSINRSISKSMSLKRNKSKGGNLQHDTVFLPTHMAPSAFS